MFGTKDQILNQLRAGVDGRAKFTEMRIGDRRILSIRTEEFASELVAFANAAGVSRELRVGSHLRK